MVDIFFSSSIAQLEEHTAINPVDVVGSNPTGGSHGTDTMSMAHNILAQEAAAYLRAEECAS